MLKLTVEALCHSNPCYQFNSDISEVAWGHAILFPTFSFDPQAFPVSIAFAVSIPFFSNSCPDSIAWLSISCSASISLWISIPLLLKGVALLSSSLSLPDAIHPQSLSSSSLPIQSNSIPMPTSVSTVYTGSFDSFSNPVLSSSPPPIHPILSPPHHRLQSINFFDNDSRWDIERGVT